jgi:hypothetical protein
MSLLLAQTEPRTLSHAEVTCQWHEESLFRGTQKTIAWQFRYETPTCATATETAGVQQTYQEFERGCTFEHSEHHAPPPWPECRPALRS